MNIRSGVLAALVLIAVSGLAEAADRVTLTGKIEQGALVFGRTEPGTIVHVGGRRVRLTAEGRFVFGIGRDRKEPVNLGLRYPDGRFERRMLIVAPRKWRIQHIRGIPKKYVTPPPSLMKRLEREYFLMRDVRKTNSALTHWTETLRWPALGRITSVFGSQRIFNGKPRSFHSGVDVGVGTGYPVRAPAGGVVTLAHPGMFFAGKTVVIDHGHGIASTLIHLSKITVAKGDLVRAGDIVGRVGRTGRATGAHLHWSLSWFQIRVDPQPIVGPMPKRRSAKPKPAQTR